MKYIVTKTEDGEREIFLFSRTIPHDVVAEAIARMKNQTAGGWRRITRTPVSAGFVEGGKCTGRSDSLHLCSQPEDTELLENQPISTP